MESEAGNQKILVRQTASQNLQTGEVMLNEERLLLRTKKRERFMLLYVENFNLITNLRKKTQDALAIILARKVTYGTNEVILDSAFRVELSKILGTTRQVIYNIIAELTDRQVFKREKREGGYVYFLNPFLFGQGEWNTIEKQRQQFTIDYDFVNMTAQKEIKTITAYEGLPNAEDIQVIKREQYNDEGILRDDVLIEDKRDRAFVDNENITESEVFGEKNESVNFLPIQTEIINADNGEKPILPASTEAHLELELLKEQNKSKELAIKELELQIKMRELELANKNQQKDTLL